MGRIPTRSPGRAVECIVILTLFCASVSYGQDRPSSMQTGEMSQREMQIENVNRLGQASAVDKTQKKAYEAFLKVSPQDPDKKIQLGNAFLKKYPKSPFDQAVDVGLTYAYYAKQDWPNFYAWADRALALNPNEVDVLTTVGWVIPHEYNPSDANAPQQLNKAENYEKHALELLPKMAKPHGVSDRDFAAMKAQKLQQAHSALGLVYFRLGSYADSAKELQQSIQGKNVDPTDLFVLGTDLQNLNRHADAAAVFTRCGQISGPLQDRCRQGAEQEKKQSGQAH